MKIKCDYCDAMFDDTEAICPHCGAPSQGVVRTSKDQPVTIEELKDWYKSKGLPPYTVTRFFIGEDYKQPKAFGIYQDPKTNKFVVYKNLASGQRKIRYEGTDQAYAVNELFMRLKEEIIQQKAAGLSGRKANQAGSPPVPGRKKKTKKRNFLPRHPILCSVLGFFVILFGTAGISVAYDLITIPAAGYYEIENQVYYHAADDEKDGWFACAADGQWDSFNMETSFPEIYGAKKTASTYLISESWNTSIPCQDAAQATVVQDYLIGSNAQSGYYLYDDTTYYHLGTDLYYSWYVYDGGDWQTVDYTSLPEPMTHSSLTEDFYYTPVWNAETQITDFEETSYFTDYQEEMNRKEDNSSYWDDDDDYSWDSSDSWDSGSTDWDSDW